MEQAAGGHMPGKIPETMIAIGIAEPGEADVLREEERPVPRPGRDQVLIRTAYAGVNRPDILQRKGLYPPPEGASDIPGLEVAGKIVAIGDGVASSLLGTQVCALLGGGGYAQYCLANANHCLQVPDGLAPELAAAFPETLFTVWHNVFGRGWARQGETLLVHGGTSGIGTMAIKLAKLFDLTVIVTCGTDEKCAAARAIGADHAINYKTADFVEEVKRITGGAGVNLVLDMVAGDYTQRNLDCLAEDGRLVTIAVLGGAKATINMAKLMVRRQTITGSTLRSRPDSFKALLAAEIEQNLWPFVEEGRLTPELDRIFPLGEAAAAHRRMEGGEHIGKIVLQVPHG
ncbi:putative PIG3 family NAD(P)H quinone oxidoreductase [Altererythrobacter atlanticus]|nr:putative PIG3 family NAD(P)H quinone oxidoreductase [Croceibacterium atlanticum]